MNKEEALEIRSNKSHKQPTYQQNTNTTRSNNIEQADTETQKRTNILIKFIHRNKKSRTANKQRQEQLTSTKQTNNHK